MNRLFGKSKAKEPAPTLSETIANTEGRAESVDKKIQKLNAEIKGYGEQMRKMRPGRARDLVKQRAARALRQKRTYENHHTTITQQAFNMEQQAFAMSTVKDTQQMVNTMESGVKELKKGMKKINIDRVDDLQDTMEDLLEQTDEMQEILGREYGCPEEIDDAELDAELDALGDMEFDMDSDILDILPSGPSGVPDVGGPIAAPAASTPAGQVPVDEFGLAEL